MKTPMMRKLAAWACGAAVYATITTANAAAPLYLQAPVNMGDGAGASTDFGQQVSDSFSLSTPATITNIFWWGSYLDNLDVGDDFHLRIFNSTVTRDFYPVALSEKKVSMLEDAMQNSVYHYEFAPPIAEDLVAGTYNLLIENLGDSEWLWLSGEATPSSQNGISVRTYDTAWMSDTSISNLAFGLSGTPSQSVPEAGSLALVLLGCAGLGMAGRRGKPAQ